MTNAATVLAEQMDESDAPESNSTLTGDLLALGDAEPSGPEPFLASSQFTGPQSTSSQSTSSQPAGTIDTGHGWFKGYDGTNLYEQWWLPENPKAVVAVVHGYAEHSGRYSHVAKTFAESGYAVYAYDHRSHGKSDGKNTYVSAFDDLVDDLELFVQHIHEQHIQSHFDIQSHSGNLPFFILGHSMGGLVTSRYMATRQPEIAGIILSGPYLAIRDDIPRWVLGLSGVVSAIAPKLPTIAIKYKHITHDPEILRQHAADQLIFRGCIPARTGAEMNRAVGLMQTDMEKIAAPLLVLHGGEDKVVPINGSERLYARAANKDKTLKIYDGLYHEILNEFEREKIKADILAWMDKRYAH